MAVTPITIPFTESAQPTPHTLRVAPVVTALSAALDLSTGQPAGHSVRTCVLGMRIGREIGLPAREIKDLFYALLLKDCGCSANASKTFHALGSDDLKAKRDVKTKDWTRIGWESLRYALGHVAPGKPFLERSRALFRMALTQQTHSRDVTRIRCERGASLARLMGLSESTALGILDLDEHWDGGGYPEKRRGAEINLFSRIMLLAQTLEVFLVEAGPGEALHVVRNRRGKWFDPDLIDAVNSLDQRGALWQDAFSTDLDRICIAMEPAPRMLEATETSMDKLAQAFASVVDAKSPFTYNHSLGVANAAVAIARTMGLPRERVAFLRHAALLHDLGKLGLSNSILDKPGKLTEDEWRQVKRHPMETWKILREIPGFDELSTVAGQHHEKLDGSGYFRGVGAKHLSLEARILAVADIFDALAADRPYREGLPKERVFEIIRKESPRCLDASCVEALEQSGGESDQTFRELEELYQNLQPHATLP